MPKSKRATKFHLTKVAKKDKKHKKDIIETTRTLLDEFNDVYVVEYHNMNNERFKAKRVQFGEGGTFLAGKCTVMKVAIGKEASSEHRQGSFQLAKFLKGKTCLLFTNLDQAQVLRKLDMADESDTFATAGDTATETVEIKEGDLPFPFSMDQTLRDLGFATRLDNRIVKLTGDFKVCQKGDVLTSQQCRILSLFKIKMGKSRLRAIARIDKDGKLYELDTDTMM